VKQGLSAGADINGLGEKWTGWTALHHAADAGHAEIVQYLLTEGADKDRITLDYSSYTALHLAVSKLHIEVVKVLLAAGADAELYTATGCCGTAFHLASSMGRNHQYHFNLYVDFFKTHLTLFQFIQIISKLIAGSTKLHQVTLRCAPRCSLEGLTCRHCQRRVQPLFITLHRVSHRRPRI
jgi:hypothetical protein